MRLRLRMLSSPTLGVRAKAAVSWLQPDSRRSHTGAIRPAARVDRSEQREDRVNAAVHGTEQSHACTVAAVVAGILFVGHKPCTH